MRWLLACSGVALLLSACSPDKGFATAEVSDDEYGSVWPLTVDEAVLACGPGDVVTLTVEGRSYGIGDITAPGDAERGLRRIWAKDPEGGPDSRRDLGPLVEDARALCG